MQESGYTYYAFVSHSHRDAKWAEWIWSALEHYRLPSNVRKAVPRPLPKKLQPVFIDKADLGSGRLIDGLYKELKASRYLIVVCSPESAKPNAEGKHFVETEVRHFVELGRTDRIIPVIVAGTPETAFCPALKELGLLAIDATKFPRRRVLNDVVAKILGLRPDELWRREERRYRGQLLWRTIVAAGVFTFLALGALVCWDNTREVTEYYANTVDDYGIPRGLWMISEAERRHCNRFYRFVYRGLAFQNWHHADSLGGSMFRLLGAKRILRSVSVAAARGVGHTIDVPDLRVFHYDMESGRADEVSCYSSDGQLIRREILSNDRGIVNGLMQYRGESLSRGVYRDSAVLSKMVDKHSDVVQFIIDRNAQGAATEVRYLDTFGNPVSDKNGEYGVRGVYDSYGFELEKWYIDRDGHRMVGRNGVSGMRYEYKDGRCVTSSCVDGQGMITFYPGDGVAMHRYSFDGHGNLLSDSCFGVDGRPIANRSGVSTIRYDNDVHGSCVRSINYGTDATPVSDAYGVCQTRYEYDAKGRLVELSYLDEHATNVVSRREKFAGVRYCYDSCGRVVRKIFIGTDGRPMKLLAGYAEQRIVYDENGQETELSYYDECGRPACDEGGISVVRKIRVGRNVVEERNYAADGRLKRRVAGCAISRFKYEDYRGNRTEERYFDEKDCPLFLPNRGTGLRWKYDGRGLLIEELYLGANGMLMAVTGCVARNVFEYDSRGRRISQRGYDAVGRLVENDDGFAGVEWEYDACGNVSQTAFIGVDGLRKDSAKGGYAIERVDFDAIGNSRRLSYFNGEGMPVCRKGGWHEVIRTYDKRSKVIEERYCGIRHEPVDNQEIGCSMIRVSYDRFGDAVTRSFYSVSNVIQGCREATCMYAYSYDISGNVLRQENLSGSRDVELFEYDMLGRTVCHRLRDSIGGCRAGKEGWTCEKMAYWENTAKLRERTFVDERPNGEMWENALFGGCGVAALTQQMTQEGRIGCVVMYDRIGSRIPTTPVVSIHSLMPGEQLAAKGVSPKSIICSFGDYSIVSPKDFGRLNDAISRQKKGMYRGGIVLADNQNGDWRIRHITLDAGRMGAQLCDVNLPNTLYLLIRSKFEAFMQQN